MSTAPPKIPRPTNRFENETVVEYEDYVDQQISKTRTNVRLVELSTSLILLVAGVVGYLLALVLVDHWVAGLSVLARVGALLVLVIGAVTFFATRVVPALIHSINPVYAAHVIEQSDPSFKNSLVNLLLLRDEKKKVRQSVYSAVEKRAAKDLSEIKVDSAVDMTSVIRAGYVLVAVMVAACLYKFVSPKGSV